MLTWSSSPACNVLVSENPEITAAKSTVQSTNKSTSNRPKTSTASTSTLSSSSTPQSPNSHTGNTNPNGGNERLSITLNKRKRRSIRSQVTKSITVIFNETAKSQSSSQTPENSSVNTNISHTRPPSHTVPHRPSETVNVFAVSDAVTGDDGTVDGNAVAAAAAAAAAADAATVMPSMSLPLSPVNQINRSKKDLVIRDADTESNANGNQFDDVQSPVNVIDDETNQNEYIKDDKFDLVTETFDDGSGEGSIDAATSSHSTALDQISDNHDNHDAAKCDDCLQNDSPSIITSKFQTVQLGSDGTAGAAIKSVSTSMESGNDARDRYRTDGTDRKPDEGDVVVVGALDTADIPAPVARPPSLSHNFDESNDIDAFVESSQPQYRMVDNSVNATEDGSPQDARTQRILVNVSIATDSGAGTTHHGVYTIQVSVPIEQSVLLQSGPIDATVAPAEMVQIPKHINQPDECDGEQLEKERPPQIPPRPPIPSFDNDEHGPHSNALDESIERTSTVSANEVNTMDVNDVGSPGEGTMRTIEVETSTANGNSTDTSSPMINSAALNCLNSFDIPPVLILEGETKPLAHHFVQSASRHKRPSRPLYIESNGWKRKQVQKNMPKVVDERFISPSASTTHTSTSLFNHLFKFIDSIKTDYSECVLHTVSHPICT